MQQGGRFCSAGFLQMMIMHSAEKTPFVASQNPST